MSALFGKKCYNEIIMDDENIKKETNKSFTIKGIPLVAIIFPPLGLMLLVKYLLNKNKKGS